MNDNMDMGSIGAPEGGRVSWDTEGNEPDLVLLAGIAEAAVLRVGELLVNRHGDESRNMKNTHGDALDYATQTDIDAERMLRDALSISGIPVHGEEENGADPLTGWCWVVDPIDGTLNWANNLPLCAVSVGLCENGVPRLGVILTPGLRRRLSIGIVGMGAWVDGEPISVSEVPAKEAVVAYDGFRDPEKDISKTIRSAVGRYRLIGSTATEMALCANGGFGAVVAPEAMFWDVAAGIALIRAAGGVAVDVNGAPHMPGSGSVIAGAGHVVAAIIDALGGSRSHADREHDEHRHLREQGSSVSHLERVLPRDSQRQTPTASTGANNKHHDHQHQDHQHHGKHGNHGNHQHGNHQQGRQREGQHEGQQRHGIDESSMDRKGLRVDENGCLWGPGVQGGDGPSRNRPTSNDPCCQPDGEDRHCC